MNSILDAQMDLNDYIKAIDALKNKDYDSVLATLEAKRDVLMSKSEDLVQLQECELGCCSAVDLLATVPRDKDGIIRSHDSTKGLFLDVMHICLISCDGIIVQIVAMF